MAANLLQTAGIRDTVILLARLRVDSTMITLQACCSAVNLYSVYASLGENAANETLITRRAIREDIYPSSGYLSHESLSSHIDPPREYLIRLITFLQFIRRAFPVSLDAIKG